MLPAAHRLADSDGFRRAVRGGRRAGSTTLVVHLWVDPDAEPYLIVKRSLADFQRQVRGTGARVVPWLQDFSLGVHYGPAEVRAQIKAARDLGIPEFIMWDAGVTYTSAAYTPR